MCGLAGELRLDGTPVDRDVLIRVRDHMTARGPDGAGAWFAHDGRLGLVHRRLSIQDLSEAGAQPMHDADAGLVLVFNGEIYNQLELRVELEAAGHRFRSRSDTEVILALYKAEGDAMLTRLRGMFALALWDAPRGRLLLARDPFGIKPLYYSYDGKRLLFASQVKALLQAPVDTAPCAAGHAGFMLWGSVPDPHTLYRGIRALPAGHSIVFDSCGVAEPRCFFDVPSHLLEVEPTSLPRREAIVELSAALHNAVDGHLLSDVPVGVFLSAGLDSAVLATLMARHGPAPRSVTLGFQEYEGSHLDEVPLAERLAATLHTDHRTVTVNANDFASHRDHFFAAMDQPTIDGVNSWFVAYAAKQAGVKVALSGLGGDEIFASYPSFHQVPRLVELTRGFAQRPRLARLVRRATSPILSQLTSPKYAGLLEYGSTFGGAYLIRRALYMPWELPALLGHDVAREGLAELAASARLAEVAESVTEPRLIVSALEMSFYMRNQLLRDADWASMEHSVEIRVPFVDIELVRRAASVVRAYPDITKSEVAGCATSLPDDVLARPKTGFAVPTREWLSRERPDLQARGLRGWARYVHRCYAGDHAFTTPRPTDRAVA